MELPKDSTTDSIESHTFLLPLDCYYLLHVPPAPSPLLWIVVHGYAMSAASMLRLSLTVLGKDQLVASVQAPHHFYPDQSKPDVGYNWGTRNHGSSSIQMHHAMLRHVRAELESRFAVPPQRTVLMGYSQPVGYNYRFAATYPEEVAGVVGICGGVPKDWETGSYGRVSASLLHIARSEDEFFPASVTSDYARKLRTRASDVEFQMLPGGHRFPSKAAPVIRAWTERTFPGLTTVAAPDAEK
ncbi:MAG: hypothetical protein HY820_08750 [Acidobacteria bacterium]|nr:hypothetical protein [Acidobacteriota bacterium]